MPQRSPRRVVLHCTKADAARVRAIMRRLNSFGGSIMRILLAGLAGGIVMFVWSWVAHDLTSLGTIGVKALPNESATAESLSSSIGDKGGLYLFPGEMAPKTSASAGASGF